MPTSKHIAANRLRPSKATARLLIEDTADFRFNAQLRASHNDPAVLTAEYSAQFNPSGRHEEFMVDLLVHQQCRIRRLHSMEACLWEHAANAVLDENSTTGVTVGAATRALDQIQRTLDACHTNYQRTLKGLLRIQAMQRQSSKTTSPKVGSFGQNSANFGPENPTQPIQRAGKA